MKKISKKLIALILVSILIIVGVIFIGYLNFKDESCNENSDGIYARFPEEFYYNYSNTDLAEKEKKVLEIAKKVAIENYGENHYRNEWPFETHNYKEIPSNLIYLKDLGLKGHNFWYVSGALYCEKTNLFKRKNTNCLGGSIEVFIDDENLNVLKIIHGK